MCNGVIFHFTIRERARPGVLIEGNPCDENWDENVKHQVDEWTRDSGEIPRVTRIKSLFGSFKPSP